VTYNTLINLANDYDKGRAVLAEMKEAGVKPNEVAYSTLISLAKDYREARVAIDELIKIRGEFPGEGQLTALLSKVEKFEIAVQLAIEFRERGFFTGRSIYEAIFAKPIIQYSAKELLGVYNNLPFKFGSSLQNPIRQYRNVGQLDQAFYLCLAAPETGAAKKFFREEFDFCKGMFEAELKAGNNEDNLFYAYGIAAILKEDWSTAKKHLEVALERPCHEKRIADIERMLKAIPD